MPAGAGFSPEETLGLENCHPWKVIWTGLLLCSGGDAAMSRRTPRDRVTTYLQHLLTSATVRLCCHELDLRPSCRLFACHCSPQGVPEVFVLFFLCVLLGSSDSLAVCSSIILLPWVVSMVSVAAAASVVSPVPVLVLAGKEHIESTACSAWSGSVWFGTKSSVGRVCFTLVQCGALWFVVACCRVVARWFGGVGGWYVVVCGGVEVFCGGVG